MNIVVSMHHMTSVNDDMNLGLYGFASDEYCLMPRTKDSKKIEKTLGVKIKTATILGTNLLGIFAKGNSFGIVVAREVKNYDDLSGLSRSFENILFIDTDYTAIGNLLLMNDNGIIASPMLRNNVKQLEAFFGIPCKTSAVAGMRIVGNLGIATNNGCLLHPKAREREISLIENILKVECDIGTVNFGSPYPGAGIIANSHGFLVNKATSGPELGRITESLGFL